MLEFNEGKKMECKKEVINFFFDVSMQLDVANIDIAAFYYLITSLGTFYLHYRSKNLSEIQKLVPTS